MLFQLQYPTSLLQCWCDLGGGGLTLFGVQVTPKPKPFKSTLGPGGQSVGRNPCSDHTPEAEVLFVVQNGSESQHGCEIDVGWDHGLLWQRSDSACLLLVQTYMFATHVVQTDEDTKIYIHVYIYTY